jgi:acyl-CoA synthetase (AMP-forming)/AMP-acid ligase II
LLEKWAEQRGEQAAFTYLDYRKNSEGIASVLSWSELAHRVHAVSSWLRRSTRPGERAAILIDQGPEYLVAFLAALRAGLVAVPLYAPAGSGSVERLGPIVTDAMPHIALTTRDRITRVGKFLDRIEPPVRQIMAVDTIADELSGPTPADVGLDDLAYLQYTTDAAGHPIGVMVTHGNAVASAWQTVTALDAVPGHSVSVSWLPLWHDMGLVLTVAAPLLLGSRAVFLDPAAFLERPVRWLRALSGEPGAISAAPDFAFAYCANRIPDREKSALRLGEVSALVDIGEPVRPDALERFTGAFRGQGLKSGVLRSSYGLAEATMLVSATTTGHPPRRARFSRKQLAMGRAVPATPGDRGTTALVSRGQPVSQLVRVVDPGPRTEVPEGRVGEIWVSGPNVGRGYWQRFEESAEMFCALLNDHGAAAEPRWWLRTGDLGVMLGGELFVTCRAEDLITVFGRNHYPQDVEETVESAHNAVRAHTVAAFTAPGDDPDDEERPVIVVAEIAEPATGGDRRVVADVITSAVALHHGLPLHEVVLLPPGGAPRTATGRISRVGCREKYCSGALSGSVVATAVLPQLPAELSLRSASD